jgi:intracellular septation protein
MTARPEPSQTEPPWLRPASDYGPIAVFFIAYVLSDLLWATGALMAATAVALGLSLAIARRVPLMPLITAGVVGVFGGLTLILQDETFIKMKPTIVQILFAAILLGGLVFGRPLLKPLMGTAWSMDDQGWRKLTFRFALFFLAMAGLNEAVWRTQSTDFWVSFKVFGILGLTLLFALAQTPLMRRHHLATEEAGGEETAPPGED